MTASGKPLAVPYRDLKRRSSPFFERMHLPNDDFAKATLKGHAGEVICLAFSRNGMTLATGGKDGRLLLWSLGGMEHDVVLRGHERTINSLAVSADGRLLLSASNDRSSRLWDLGSMKPIGEPMAHTDLVLAAAIAPDGKMFATASRDGELRLCRVRPRWFSAGTRGRHRPWPFRPTVAGWLRLDMTARFASGMCKRAGLWLSRRTGSRSPRPVPIERSVCGR